MKRMLKVALKGEGIEKCRKLGISGDQRVEVILQGSISFSNVTSGGRGHDKTF